LSEEHKPVLLEEALAALAIRPSGKYVDATFGRGGHTRAILAALGPEGSLVAIDQDPEAIASGRETFAEELRLRLWHGSFGELEKCIDELGWRGEVDGILVDLGVSSPQLDTAERGFSFLVDGPLDMRMNPAHGTDAAFWIAQAREQDIEKVLRDYGEERYARRIAKAIVKARAQTPITRTRQLAEIVAVAHPRWEPFKHPATRSFQAIRIFINQELQVLELVLPQCLAVLKTQGRLAVISFHSLEDRIVKNFMRKAVRGDDYPPDLPVTADQLHPQLRMMGKAVRAGEEELRYNPRARSAVMRVAEKL
jgi:16S rRNA (cytosine1402-N4)-methyltransferase